ncbi:helix-turn-helix transcriptional regulator [Lentzea nigeriaca]|uniref:helix-turn-helix transcriptional regulator n=1 Tax=Lentzea nigeriaca TaxID=1128665 RepID=UPI0019574347|nr:LuxR family transcriptional regulator [Lentzea nigeriaca]MBM7863825.1 DNA-binding CsgD family transcriptional regulator [Lentzea nigeriaca]
MIFEQEALAALLADARSGHGGALVLRGGPGDARTTLLRWAADRAAGMTVLSGTGVRAEAELVFAGLQQLLTPLDSSVLPEPHRSAIEVVLGRSTAACTDLVVYTAVLRLLRSAGPVLVIVDDLQWWDRSSATALGFCARRVADAPVAFVLATDGPALDLPELVLPGTETTDRSDVHRAPAASGPDEDLAAALEAEATTASRRGGLATAADLLRRAADLSAPSDRERRLAAAGYAAWKSGHPALARSLTASVSDAAALDRLHGLIALSDDDQRSAHDHLVRAAMRRPPEEAVGLLFMAVAAALHADIDTTPALAHLSEAGAELGFTTFVEQLARLRVGTTADPWQLRATAPAALLRSDVHQWLWPLVIARHGADPRAALRFGIEARTSFSVNGMQAVLAFPELWLAELEHELGHWNAAFSRAGEGLRSARETGQRARAADFHAVLALAAPNPELCREHASAALALAVPLHNRLAAAKAAWALGQLALSTGDNETAVAHLSAIAEPTSPTGHTLVSRWAAADLVEACLRNGTPAGHVALPPATTPLLRSRRCRARALLTGTPELFAEAAAEAFPDHPHEQARAALLHGEWLRRNKHQSRSQLRLAHDTFTHLGATHWTRAAALQLRPATGTATGLTPQELSVARLAAQGLTNKEIGARLFLSPRTVGHHLYKIFPKLGIATRSQLRELDLDHPAR